MNNRKIIRTIAAMGALISTAFITAVPVSATPTGPTAYAILMCWPDKWDDGYFQSYEECAAYHWADYCAPYMNSHPDDHNGALQIWNQCHSGNPFNGGG